MAGGPARGPVSKTYRPDPVRRATIPTIRDRVVQAAAKIALEPIMALVPYHSGFDGLTH